MTLTVSQINKAGSRKSFSTPTFSIVVVFLSLCPFLPLLSSFFLPLSTHTTQTSLYRFLSGVYFCAGDVCVCIWERERESSVLLCVVILWDLVQKDLGVIILILFFPRYVGACIPSKEQVGKGKLIYIPLFTITCKESAIHQEKSSVLIPPPSPSSSPLDLEYILVLRKLVL